MAIIQLLSETFEHIPNHFSQRFEFEYGTGDQCLYLVYQGTPLPTDKIIARNAGSIEDNQVSKKHSITIRLV